MDLGKILFIILPVVILINFFLIKNHNFFFIKKIIDNEFKKPQAFHNKPTPRIGGFFIFLFLNIFIIFFFRQYNFFYSIFFLSNIFFLLGFLSDINFNIKPELRLFIMLIFSLVVIYNLNINILNTELTFLNKLLQNNKFFSSVFVCLCFLFIINGCNFIDGFNGLLIIHSIIMLSILYFINFQNSNIDYLKYLIIFLIIICLSLLFFNFPRAKIFLGDGGSYFLGSLISLIVIELSNSNLKISPFFFSCLLFYIFFEVFFSFFRKLFFNKTSPLNPDKYHLHMLLYRFIYSKNKNIEKANYLTGLLINVAYSFLILPLLFNYKSSVFCKMYFLFLVTVYLFCYLCLLSKKN
jgi:UDP-N-acetylmuramyl pentapeptide phosphotransferase/UDP-N-acetylglucosamine-1-phosphate transferase